MCNYACIGIKCLFFFTEPNIFWLSCFIGSSSAKGLLHYGQMGSIHIYTFAPPQFVDYSMEEDGSEDLAGEQYLDDGLDRVKVLEVGVQGMASLLGRQKLLQLPQHLLPHLQQHHTVNILGQCKNRHTERHMHI